MLPTMRLCRDPLPPPPGQESALRLDDIQEGKQACLLTWSSNGKNLANPNAQEATSVYLRSMAGEGSKAPEELE